MKIKCKTCESDNEPVLGDVTHIVHYSWDDARCDIPVCDKCVDKWEGSGAPCSIEKLKPADE